MSITISWRECAPRYDTVAQTMTASTSIQLSVWECGDFLSLTLKAASNQFTTRTVPPGSFSTARFTTTWNSARNSKNSATLSIQTAIPKPSFTRTINTEPNVQSISAACLHLRFGTNALRNYFSRATG